MGVHDVQHYPEIKRLLGIPEDEPIFIFRAQDMLMGDVVDDYRRRYTQRALTMGASTAEIDRFASELESDIYAISAWQETHKDVVKVPD